MPYDDRLSRRLVEAGVLIVIFWAIGYLTYWWFFG
ncbi:hypothetical protein ACVMIH_007391 [Bradyrhizobium sp. USDA 4503]